jgi:hypothetical protein
MKTGSSVNIASSHVVTYCTAESKGWDGSRVARRKLPTLKGVQGALVARAEGRGSGPMCGARESDKVRSARR